MEESPWISIGYAAGSTRDDVVSDLLADSIIDVPIVLNLVTPSIIVESCRRTKKEEEKETENTEDVGAKTVLKLMIGEMIEITGKMVKAKRLVNQLVSIL